MARDDDTSSILEAAIAGGVALGADLAHLIVRLTDQMIDNGLPAEDAIVGLKTHRAAFAERGASEETLLIFDQAISRLSPRA